MSSPNAPGDGGGSRVPQDGEEVILKKVKLERSPTVGVPCAQTAIGDMGEGSEVVFLANVGLQEFAPGLRRMGFRSIEDFVAVRSSDLEMLGLSPVQINIFKLLQAQIPNASNHHNDISLADMRVDDDRKSQAWIPSVVVECGICEESVVSSHAVCLDCCRVSYCYQCLRRFLSGPIVHDKPLVCPSPACAKQADDPIAAMFDDEHVDTKDDGMGELTTEEFPVAATTRRLSFSQKPLGDSFSLLTVAAVFRDHCVVCSEPLNEGDSTRNNCSGLHTFCTSCFRTYVVSMIRSHRIPRCPRWRECRQQYIDAGIVDTLCRDDPESLAKFYNLNVENARAIHRFTRPCPRSDCTATIPIPPSRAAVVLNSRDGSGPGITYSDASGLLTVRCQDCGSRWCTACWRCAHPNLDCQTAIGIEAKWLQFKQLQVNVSEDMRNAMRQYADVLVSCFPAPGVCALGS
mgnify:FL=1